MKPALTGAQVITLLNLAKLLYGLKPHQSAGDPKEEIYQFTLPGPPKTPDEPPTRLEYNGTFSQLETQLAGPVQLDDNRVKSYYLIRAVESKVTQQLQELEQWKTTTFSDLIAAAERTAK